MAEAMDFSEPLLWRFFQQPVSSINVVYHDPSVTSIGIYVAGLVKYSI